MSDYSRFDRELMRMLLTLAGKDAVDHFLFVTDVPLTSEHLRGRRRMKDKLVYATASPRVADKLKGRGFRVLQIPPYDFAPSERAKIAVVKGTGEGVFLEDQLVLCALARPGTRIVDTVLKFKIGQSLDEQQSIDTLEVPEGFAPQIVQTIVDLAVEIGHRGYEGHPVGTIFVVGDSDVVLSRSRQLTLDPFGGMPEAERNVVDPHIAAALKNFSVLDGAFVIREDGTVLASGRYLESLTDRSKVLPLGLGARHAAAAAITHEARCLAVTLSQSSGAVRVFYKGEAILELGQVARRVGLAPVAGLSGVGR